MGTLDFLNIEDLQRAVHASLSSWSDLASSEEQLLAGMLLVRQARSEQVHSGSKVELRQITNQVLQSALDELATEKGKEVRVLEARFVRGRITREVANYLHASPDQINRWQRSAIKNLSQILFGWETKLRQEKVDQLEASIPPSSYDRLFGFEHAREIITRHLTDDELAPIVLITGIGGIGKTSLADAAARSAVQTLNFDHAIWLRVTERNPDGKARPPESVYESLLATMAGKLWPGTFKGSAVSELEQRIQDALKDASFLVIVDNLETSQGTAHVLEKGQAWVEPSRILITSRARPTTLAPAFLHSVDELDSGDALALLRHQAAMQGQDDLAQADDRELLDIYEVTGGNPLALKLVASLTTAIPLSEVLSDLVNSRLAPIEELYRRIYWEAWRSLSAQAHSLLQAMPLVAESGATPDQMQAMSGLTDDEFWEALRELVSRSLLEVGGSVRERRYGIHRLTDTFLRTEIINWPETGQVQ